MFIAVELTPKTLGKVDHEDEYNDMAALLGNVFTPIEADFRDVFKDNFLATFEECTEVEKERMENKSATPVMPVSPKQSPHHDVESLFWILSYNLARALPEGAKQECSNADSFCRLLLHQSLSKLRESRATIFDFRERSWRRILHSGLCELAPMLASMGVLFRLRWSLHIFQPHQRLLLHQAFKRLLFKEILRMEQSQDIIPLDTTCPREVHLTPGEEIAMTAKETNFTSEVSSNQTGKGSDYFLRSAAAKQGTSGENTGRGEHLDESSGDPDESYEDKEKTINNYESKQMIHNEAHLKTFVEACKVHSENLAKVHYIDKQWYRLVKCTLKEE